MIAVFEGRREALTYSDWRKLGWSKPESERLARDHEPGGPNEVRQAFLYCSGDHVERERMAVNAIVPTAAGEQPATRRDEFAFEWGYGGTGPHATARAILGQLLLEEAVGWVSQQFKQDVIAKIDGDHFEVTAADIGTWADWAQVSHPPPSSYPQARSQLEKLAAIGRRARRQARAT